MKTANSRPSDTAIRRALLLTEETFSLVLLLLVVDMYGAEVFNWAPETIRRELEEDFRIKLPKVSLDKVMAAVTLVTTNYFSKDVTKFIEICNILAGDDFEPSEFEPADAAEILHGVSEAALIWPFDDESSDFSPEVREYVAQVLKAEGITHPFDVLRIASESDTEAIINSEFSDDPAMFSAIYESQNSKRKDMLDVLRSNMSALRQQLELLPLRNGEKGSTLKRLDKMLQNHSH